MSDGINGPSKTIADYRSEIRNYYEPLLDDLQERNFNDGQTIAMLRGEVENLKARNTRLEAENADLKRHNDLNRKLCNDADSIMAELEAENAELRNLLGEAEAAIRWALKHVPNLPTNQELLNLPAVQRAKESK